MNLSLLISETFIVFVGQQHMTGPPMGGDHNGFTQSFIGDFLPMPERFLGRDCPG
jgi:hypothetical protein